MILLASEDCLHMPTQDQVFEAADALLAEGQRPSRRKVHDRLANGGSPGPILKHLDAWREAQRYKPQLDHKELPKSLKERSDTLLKETWRLAQGEAALGWQLERASLEEIRRDEAEDREHLLGLLQESEVKAQGLAAQLEMAVADAERLRAALAISQDQLGRSRSEAFWDRVMQEVRAILPAEGGMTPEEILATLQPWTKRGASVAKQKLTPGTLKLKMEDRAHWGRYLMALDDGRFVRQTDEMVRRRLAAQ